VHRHPAHNTPPPSPPHFPPRPPPPQKKFEFRSPPPQSVPLHHAHTYLLTYLTHTHLPTFLSPPVTVLCFQTVSHKEMERSPVGKL
jgi:hypothetical protein